MIPFLLVPGLNCTGRVFADAVDALWPHGQVTIANHLSGETIDEIAATILRDAPPRFALVGFSMGGYVSLAIWRQARHRVAGLALLDTMARADRPEETANRHAAIALARREGVAAVVMAGTANAVHPDNADDRDLRDIRLAMAESLGVEAYIRHQRAIVARPDSTPDLAGIGVPTAIIVGSADRIAAPGESGAMAAAIAGSVLTSIDAAGHFAPLEQPVAVGAALSRWARSLEHGGE